MNKHLMMDIMMTILGLCAGFFWIASGVYLFPFLMEMTTKNKFLVGGMLNLGIVGGAIIMSVLGINITRMVNNDRTE